MISISLLSVQLLFLARAIAEAVGSASMTRLAKSEMKVLVQFRAGTRPQFSMPDSRASSLYSMSISSRVSMCSLTKLQLFMKINESSQRNVRKKDINHKRNL